MTGRLGAKINDFVEPHFSQHLPARNFAFFSFHSSVSHDFSNNDSPVELIIIC